jgi:hypothetical protein
MCDEMLKSSHPRFANSRRPAFLVGCFALMSWLPLVLVLGAIVGCVPIQAASNEAGAGATYPIPTPGGPGAVEPLRSHPPGDPVPPQAVLEATETFTSRQAKPCGDDWFDAAMRQKLVATMEVLASGSAEQTAQVFNNHLELPYPLPATSTQSEFLTWYPLVFTPKALEAIRRDLASIAQDPTKIILERSRRVRFGDGYLCFSGRTVPGNARYLEPDIRGFESFHDREALQAKQAEAEKKRKQEGDHWFDAAMRQKLVATMEVLASGAAERTAMVFNDHLPLPYPLITTSTHQDFLAWYPLVFTPKVMAAIRGDFAIIAKDPGKIDVIGWRGAMIGDGYLWFRGNKVPEHPQFLEPDIGALGVFFDDRQALEVKRRAAIDDLRTRLLHPSLAEFSEPFCDGTTPSWQFRMDRLSPPTSEPRVNYIAAEGQIRYQSPHGPTRFRLTIWPKSKTWRDQPTWIITVIRVIEQGGSIGDSVWYMSEEPGLFGYLSLDEPGDDFGFLILHTDDRVVINQPVWECHE